MLNLFLLTMLAILLLMGWSLMAMAAKADGG
jgi:hypothetical protein